MLIAMCDRRRLSHALFAVSPVLSLSFLDAVLFPLSAAALQSLKAQQRAAECPLGDVWMFVCQFVGTLAVALAG